jgi:hypothetical protein
MGPVVAGQGNHLRLQLADWLAGWSASWLDEFLVGRLISWLGYWLLVVGRLAG